jgi:probable biosynthetic protein (TIGR04098 family)
MPYLGRNNLSESALFRVLGNDRWTHLRDVTGTRSADIKDDAGHRLYATFFFVDVNLSPERSLASYRENEMVRFETELFHFGGSHLDGTYVLQGTSDSVRMCNVFIHQQNGPSRLAVGFPANVDFSGIQQLATAPDSLQACREAKVHQRFLEPLPGDRPIFEGEREFEYVLDPDRDLNGAGLVYFANFVCFLDRAERQILRSLPAPVPTTLLDRRSTYRRCIGYFGNAEGHDLLKITCAARSRRCTEISGDNVIDFGFDCSIRRASDGKEIVISSCRKVAAWSDGESEAWVKAYHG